jgi:hypothetical protein
MNPECGKEWTRKFLRLNFTNKFLTTKYKNHLEDILYQQQVALLPNTQQLAEKTLRKRNIYKEILDIRNQKKELEMKINELNKQIYHLTNQYDNDEEITERRIFMKHCPSEDCRGFLSSQWKCGLCEKWYCPHCHELKGMTHDAPHQCNPDNVETAKLIRQDSKPCPKCHSLIFKINGCDQMFCTKCHTPFSWKSGTIYTSNIHNPHYYEWLRTQNGEEEIPRNPNDIQCGRYLDSDYLRKLRKLLSYSKSHNVSSYFNEDYYYFEDIIRNLQHNAGIIVTRYQTNQEQKNEVIRVKYLLKEINESRFKALIQQNYKSNMKHQEMVQVFGLTQLTMRDILYGLLEKLVKSENKKDAIEECKKEILNFIAYCNELLRDIAFTYNSTLYYFSDTFKFLNVQVQNNELSSENASAT